MPAGGKRPRRRVLILSAEVGEGHAAAARALASRLESRPDAPEVKVVDGVEALGRLLRLLVEDGYRVQLNIAPWSYTAFYQLLAKVAPVRWLVKQLLYLIGSRGLARCIERYQPDVVVSTYPAVTVVLARLRRRGEVAVPTVATITDLTGLFYWAQPGIDLHLVCYPESLPDVERIAGRGSAQLVAPLISAEFLKPRCPIASRRLLGLPEEGKLVVVSGGGWGVGDVEGAVSALRQIDEVGTIVCLCGKNGELRERLRERFKADPKVQVWGFTDRMPLLLAAADVLVHSTGGVTCLEALAVDLPVVSYGLPVGHAAVNTREMAKLQLVALAEDLGGLQELVRTKLKEPRAGARGASFALRRDPAEAVLSTPQRVRPIPSWRLRLGAVLAEAAVVLLGGLALLSTDEINALAALVLRVHPLVRVQTELPAVAIVARDREPLPVAKLVGAVGLTLTFAVEDPRPGLLGPLARLGDGAIPAVATSRQSLRWVDTSATLRKEAQALGLTGRTYFVPPRNGLVLGQLVEAKTAGDTPVYGALDLDGPIPPPLWNPRPGDVLVVNLPRNPQLAAASLERLAGWLNSRGFAVVSLARLLASASISPNKSGERARAAAAPTNAAIDSANAAPRRGS